MGPEFLVTTIFSRFADKVTHEVSKSFIGIQGFNNSGFRFSTDTNRKRIYELLYQRAFLMRPYICTVLCAVC